MTTWKNASLSDLQIYESIARVFQQHSYLLDLFFERETPRIRLHSEKILKKYFSKFLIFLMAKLFWSKLLLIFGVDQGAHLYGK